MKFMNIIKHVLGLLAAFIGGVAVTFKVMDYPALPSSSAIETQASWNRQPAAMPVMLEESIKLPVAASSTKAVPKAKVPTLAVASLGNDATEGKSNAGKSITSIKSEKTSEPVPQPEMIELPLESEIDGEAPEPEEFENAASMVDSEELSKSGIEDNSSVQNLQMKK
jgi:hypothetical protein